MRVPIRKGHARLGQKPDPYMTPAKYEELSVKLKRMKDSSPRLASEVKRLAEMGDFSENAGYQLAKGRLRGLNQRILELENHLKMSVIIEPNKDLKTVQIGSTVTVLKEGKEITYSILGSTETDPNKQVISYLSPLGSLLMGRQAQEEVVLEVNGREVRYRVIKVETPRF